MVRGSRRSLRLRDGRELAWHEFGDPSGVPCIYTTGLTASGAAGRIYDAAASAAGVRWISVDKPGYGGSHFRRRRRFVDWPHDIAQLADHLGLERFAVAGESGGGPHALAIAHALPSRVSVVLVIAGMGVWRERWMRKHLKPQYYEVYDTARRNPRKMRQNLLKLKRTLDDPARREEWVKQILASATEGDREIFRAFPDVLPTAIEAYREALDAGPAAAIHEMRMCTKRWGFRLWNIAAPVELWHGTADENVPVKLARDVAARIPKCTARFIENAGHALYRSLDGFMAAVIAHGGRRQKRKSSRPK